MSSSGDEPEECGTCLQVLIHLEGRIHMCPEWHPQCHPCFALLGGSEALCPTCGVVMGNLRQRALERKRDKRHLEKKSDNHARLANDETTLSVQE